MATISGTVSELYVHNGDNVTAGSPMAKIVASMDLSMDFLFPFASPRISMWGRPPPCLWTAYAGLRRAR